MYNDKQTDLRQCFITAATRLRALGNKPNGRAAAILESMSVDKEHHNEHITALSAAEDHLKGIKSRDAMVRSVTEAQNGRLIRIEARQRLNYRMIRELAEQIANAYEDQGDGYARVPIAPIEELLKLRDYVDEE